MWLVFARICVVSSVMCVSAIVFVDSFLLRVSESVCVELYLKQKRPFHFFTLARDVGTPPYSERLAELSRVAPKVESDRLARLLGFVTALGTKVGMDLNRL